MPTDLKSYTPKDRKAWRSWLQKYGAKETGVWLIFYKKGSGKSNVSYNDAVEEALCFGWIDSVMQPIDEEKYMQRFSPRKVKSVWSALNKKRVEQMIAQKKMMPAGMAIIEIGKQNGSWTKLDDVENYVIPAELSKLFKKNKKVFRYFESLSKSNQKLWLYRLNSAKLAETKTRRLKELVGAASKD